jgi:4-hydroxy-3-polyprenylbenzoate decarboxylase
VELVRCLTQPELEVPADADFVIEGYVDPGEEPIWEGPFGDHTGYYSLPDWYPRFHVTCVTHRKDAVYPSTIVGIPPEEDAWIGKATERIFLAPMKMTMVPEIVDMEMPVEGVFHNLVIASIRKEYPGQAQKVMNAMWGAGQMMFNKILVVVDEGTDIHHYGELAKYVFSNLDAREDIYFSQGPMDVLDHSCSTLGFGGKMCIDGTRKWPEERPGGEQVASPSLSLDTASIIARFPEIRAVNATLVEKGIGCILVSVEKNRKGHLRELHRELAAMMGPGTVKMVLYVEHTVGVTDLATALWRFCNNLDPKRDHMLEGACMGLDGTLKTALYDDFHRPWPNIIVSDVATIKAVDEKWNSLGIGPFLPSPSLNFRDQLYGEGASVESPEKG